MTNNERLTGEMVLATSRGWRYGSRVAANSATGFGDSIRYRRTSAPVLIAGAFFVPAMPIYGGCAWETERSAGFLCPRFANPRTAATLIRLATIRGSSSIGIGATSMRTTLGLNPSKSHAAAWKARAFAALRANSSLSVRLRRYNEAMARARALEGRSNTPDSGYLNVSQDHICTDRARQLEGRLNTSDLRDLNEGKSHLSDGALKVGGAV